MENKLGNCWISGNGRRSQIYENEKVAWLGHVERMDGRIP